MCTYIGFIVNICLLLNTFFFSFNRHLKNVRYVYRFDMGNRHKERIEKAFSFRLISDILNLLSLDYAMFHCCVNIYNGLDVNRLSLTSAFDAFGVFVQFHLVRYA